MTGLAERVLRSDYDALAADNAALRGLLREAKGAWQYVAGGRTMIGRIDAFLQPTDSADDVTCPHCGLGEQFDGVWHKPDCPTLNHPIQKPSPPMTGVGDGEGNAPKNSR